MIARGMSQSRAISPTTAHDRFTIQGRVGPGFEAVGEASKWRDRDPGTLAKSDGSSFSSALLARYSTDYTTFFVMLWVFHCWDPSRALLFQTGWFMESLMTQTLIIHVIRTNKTPFIQSRASLPLTATTLSIMVFGLWLPHSPLAPSLGLTHLPQMYWPILMLTLLAYVSLTQVIKVWLLRRNWIYLRLIPQERSDNSRRSVTKYWART